MHFCGVYTNKIEIRKRHWEYSSAFLVVSMKMRRSLSCYRENGEHITEKGYATNLTTDFALDWLSTTRNADKPKREAVAPL